jgi:hypothetical protein
MLLRQLITVLFPVACFYVSCKDAVKEPAPVPAKTHVISVAKDSMAFSGYTYYEDSVFYGHRDSLAFTIKPDPGFVLSNSYSYYSDSIFHGYKALLTAVMKKYAKDTCPPISQPKENFEDWYEGFSSVGDVNHDRKNDSIFVLPPLNYCEEGDAYYFTDTSLPRLLTTSMCCHPTNVFKMADIDEDGICEVGYYYSSCASRYKSLRFFSLKNNEWVRIGASEFDILTQDPGKVRYKDLIRKIAKNKFVARNFYDGDKYWDTITMK